MPRSDTPHPPPTTTASYHPSMCPCRLSRSISLSKKCERTPQKMSSLQHLHSGSRNSIAYWHTLARTFSTNAVARGGTTNSARLASIQRHLGRDGRKRDPRRVCAGWPSQARSPDFRVSDRATVHIRRRGRHKTYFAAYLHSSQRQFYPASARFHKNELKDILDRVINDALVRGHDIGTVANYLDMLIPAVVERLRRSWARCEGKCSQARHINSSNPAGQHRKLLVSGKSKFGSTNDILPSVRQRLLVKHQGM
ncbi:hypothetical protein V8E36_000256 [Tilletia maclaganii]